MSEIKAQESQEELFPEFSGEPKRAERFPTFQKTQKPILFTTNTEQLLLAAILLVLFGCLIFFLGVLRGRSINSHERAVRSVIPTQKASLVTTPPRPAAPAAVTLSAPSAAKPATLPAPLSKTLSAPMLLDESKPYTIQLVTHKKKEFAEKEVAALRRNGAVAWIIPSGEYQQVCAGQYRDREEARKDLKIFSAKYKDCFLRRR